jgi:protein involved in polysaccharide export with SLBB domain
MANGQRPSPEASAEARRLYKEGVKHGEAGRFNEAAAYFERAINLNPDYADAYLSLGHAYSDLHQWDRAIESLQRGLALKPKDKDGTDRLAHARLMLERETSGRDQNPLDGDAARVKNRSTSSLKQAGRSPAPKAANEIDLTTIYRVGPGDVLDVRLGADASAQPALFTVTPTGLLEHPDLSTPLSCAGLTVEEITARLQERLKQSSSTATANVSVSVNEFVSHTILVSGLVKEPGPKILKREAIPLYAVAADAQPLPEAGSVTVARHEPNESYVIDSVKPAEMNMLVQPGDVITFQALPAQFIYVSGEVKSPGEKSFHRGLTLTQAIIAAGGVPRKLKEARLSRDNGKGFLVVNRYKLKDIDSGRMPDPLLQPGDRVTVTK